MQKRYTLTTVDGESITLPVSPSSYEETNEQNVETFETVLGGEIAVIGGSKLKKIRFGSFLPKQNYPFLVTSFRDPVGLKSLLQSWQESKKPLRLLISDTNINRMYSIQQIEFRESDATGDIYYSMDLVEYRELNTPSEKNTAPIHPVTSLRARPVSPQSGGQGGSQGGSQSGSVSNKRTVTAARIKSAVEVAKRVAEGFKSIQKTELWALANKVFNPRKPVPRRKNNGKTTTW